MRGCVFRVARIWTEATGLKFDGWWTFIVLTVLAIIACAFFFEAWLLLLPAILLPGTRALSWPRLRSSAEMTDIFNGCPVGDRAHVQASASPPSAGSVQSRRAQMSQIVDQILERYPHSPEARLIKASMLWHFNGDREGARSHCREILGRIRREDPLFEQVCNLYLRTHEVDLSRSMLPALNIAADDDPPVWSPVPGPKSGKIIPLPPKQPPQSAPQ